MTFLITILNIIVFLIVLGVIIFIHELGHFFFARRADILCHEFALGMGPAVYQKEKGEITYSIRAIPLGGYVSMAGEEMGSVINKENRIGLNLDKEGNVVEFILTEEVEHQIFGKVNDLDLVGEDYAPLFIEMLVDGELIKYNVSRTAKYIFTEKKKMQIAPAERNYQNKTLWQRFLVVFAGPAANFLLAFFLLFILAFFIGKPSNKNVIGKVDTNVITDNRIQKGDVVTAVNGKSVSTFDDIRIALKENANDTIVFTIDNEDVVLDLSIVMQGLGFTNQFGNRDVLVGQSFGKEKDLLSNDKILGIFMSKDLKVSEDLIDYTSINNWADLIKYSSNNSELEHVYLKVERNGEIKEISYVNLFESTITELGSSYIGYGAGFSQNRSFNILYPLYYPFLQIGSDVKEMFTTIGLLFKPNTGVGVGDLSGPIGIFSIVSGSIKNGFSSFIQLVAFLSINIGLLNLLPIPALDGGRLVFIGYEAVTRKKVNQKVENTLITITFVLLFALMIFVTFKDIIRLF
ncbi:MAG TPA: RIP metalloprotease RseP [Haploplasma sp.]|nr:RIP metalloprotease RseP [Haploplasma sp.]